MKSKADIAIAVDSKWLERYSKRENSDIRATEKVSISKNIVCKLGKDIPLKKASAEFVGVQVFSKNYWLPS